MLVDRHVVRESSCENLLGMIINNNLTWHNHLHGDRSNKGLLSKLSQRAGLIRRLSHFMPQERLKIISNGIFFSLLSYGLPVYGSVSGLFRYLDGPERLQALCRDDSHQIQVLMNIILRAITKLPVETPIKDLLKQSGFMSFHQICAYSTLKLTHKIQINKTPLFLYNRIFEDGQRINRPRRQNSAQTKFRLSVSRESFVSQASKLFFCLPEDIQSTTSQNLFKSKARAWVEANIPIYM